MSWSRGRRLGLRLRRPRRRSVIGPVWVRQWVRRYGVRVSVVPVPVLPGRRAVDRSVRPLRAVDRSVRPLRAVDRSVRLLITVLTTVRTGLVVLYAVYIRLEKYLKSLLFSKKILYFIEKIHFEKYTVQCISIFYEKYSISSLFIFKKVPHCIKKYDFFIFITKYLNFSYYLFDCLYQISVFIVAGLP